MPTPKNNVYSIADIYALPEGQRAELIDGNFYNKELPSPFHQELLLELAVNIRNHIKEKGYKIYTAPFAVFLNQDEYNYVEPDISVICDQDKLDDKGCNGVPDWIIEIVSPNSQHMDYLTKLFKYYAAGVREYWIVNPMTSTVQVYSFEGFGDAGQYSFNEKVPVNIYDGFKICIADLLK